jgi:hypothetical protein
MFIITIATIFLLITACCCGSDNKTAQECQDQLDGQVAQFDKNYSSGASISLTKVASPATFKQAGDVITYTYTLTNTGGYPFESGIRITDDKLIPVCPEMKQLGRDKSFTCTGSYTITAADVAAGQVTNTASAQASQSTEFQCVAGGVGDKIMRKTGSYTATASASATVILDVHPALTLVKTAVPGTYSGGQYVDYTYTLTNSGDVPLSGPFTVSDSRIKRVICPSQAVLLPGQSMQCSATYLIDAGLRWTITNTATGYGMFDGKPVVSNTASFGVRFIQPTPKPAPNVYSAGYCGDGIVTPPEQCDPPNGQNCDAECQLILD